MTPSERVTQLYTSECTCPFPSHLVVPSDLLRPLMVNCRKCLTDMVRLDRREAILTERERCAKVARSLFPKCEKAGCDCNYQRIAAAIREDPSDG
jgi:hypothetical protein